MSPILNGKKEIKNQRTGTPKSRTRWFLNGFQKRNKKWRKLQNQWFLDDVSPSFLFWPEDSIYNDQSTNQPTNQPTNPQHTRCKNNRSFDQVFFGKEVDLVTTKLNHTKFWSLRKPYAVNFGCASSMLGKSKMLKNKNILPNGGWCCFTTVLWVKKHRLHKSYGKIKDLEIIWVGGFNPFEKYARQIGSFPIWDRDEHKNMWVATTQ